MVLSMDFQMTQSYRQYAIYWDKEGVVQITSKMGRTDHLYWTRDGYRTHEIGH